MSMHKGIDKNDFSKLTSIIGGYLQNKKYYYIFLLCVICHFLVIHTRGSGNAYVMGIKW